MKLLLKRTDKCATSTIGELYIDGQFECFTLEDTVRDHKIPTCTAIPQGTYALVLDHSTRFGRIMPHLLDVPEFQGVRIHCGNTDKNTEGCVLVGREKHDNCISLSHLAFESLFKKLERCSAPMVIRIENDF